MKNPNLQNLVRPETWYQPCVLGLRSSDIPNLIVPRTRCSTIGPRAFPVAGAEIWNSLPLEVTSAPTLAAFRRSLKTHLFTLSFPGLLL